MTSKRGTCKPAGSSDDEQFKKSSKNLAISESSDESSDGENLPKQRGFKAFAQLSSSEEELEPDGQESDSKSSSSSSESSLSEEDSNRKVELLKSPPLLKPKAKAEAKATYTERVVSDNLDNIEVPLEPKAKPKAASKKGAKKNYQVNEEDDDLDALLAEVLPSSVPEEQHNSVTSFTQLLAPQSEDESGETKQISAKTLKNRLKKQKKKQAAVAATETKEHESHLTAKGKAKAKSKSAPKSAAAVAAQRKLQQLHEEQKQREEQERRLKEEEDKREAEERERIRLEEEEKEKKRKLKQEKKERQRKEGKPLTHAAKEKARKAEVARQQLIESIKLELPDGASPLEQKKKSKVVDDKKKKKKKSEFKIEEIPEEKVEEKVEEPQQVNDESKVESPLAAELTEEPANWEDWLDNPPPTAIGSDPNQGRKPAPKDGWKEKLVHPLPNRGKSYQNEKSSGFLSEDGELENPNPSKHTVMSKQELQTSVLRSPICCILGHVDTGKTKLLDKIRHTNVQSNEAGGITQQIGATFFPQEALWEQCKKIEPGLEMRVPGLLIIDTPGHESFNNLRARGSSLCDIAILVVDIMHGLEPQTRESLGLLRSRKCPFIVALNKIDRLYGWAAVDWAPAKQSLEKQKESTRDEFEKRADDAILQLAEEGLNCSIWWTVDDVRKTVSIAPTSAITGEGIPDLLLLLVKLTQSVITKALVFRSQFQCTILEVKTVEGLGTTIDVVLVSGTLYENDKIVVCGMTGAIVTTIRALLTPQPLKELRVKGEYIHHKSINAAMGVKISAQGLEDAVAGTSLFVARDCDDEQIENLKEEVMADMASIFKSVDRSGEGVYVMASTLGSLEALLQFLKDSKIPVFAVNLGTVHKLDVKKASVMREKGRPDLSCILAFDVKVEPDAQKEAASLGVRIFTADIIYHLFDAFTKYVQEQLEEKKKEHQNEAVFPCILSILPNCVFNKKDPIVLGVRVEDGILVHNTPLCVPEKDRLMIGRVSSLEHNKKSVDKAKKGDEVAIKIIGDSTILVGRHFDHTHKLYSRLTRDSIDCLKEYFRDELTKDDWKTVLKMKKVLDIT